jgi:hypothetical protein
VTGLVGVTDAVLLPQVMKKSKVLLQEQQLDKKENGDCSTDKDSVNSVNRGPC